jgi:TolA-binding protein
MATQELKSVTIRVPSNLLELIEARVSDRDTRTDVIINLLKQALQQPTLKGDVDLSDMEQKLSEVNQRVNDLADLLNDVRQQITQLDNRSNDDRDELIAKQLESFESRLSIVEKSKSTTESHAQKQLELIEPESIKIDPIDETVIKPTQEAVQVTKEGLQPLTQAELADRFGGTKYRSQISERKYDLTEWSKSKDPDGIAWEYRAETKKYYPLNM